MMMMTKLVRLCLFALVLALLSCISSGSHVQLGAGRRELRTQTLPRRELLEWEDPSLPLASTMVELGHHSYRSEEQRKSRRRLDSGDAAADAQASSPAAPAGPPKGSLLTPLYPGYGTHFSYVYIGTPPQRQSVIIDTGSHYTAFPCTGCSQCGQHTDQYWDLKNSSTASVPKCQNQPCVISQSYSEGSSWRAFKVVDKLWVGGLETNLVPSASSYAVDFLFGCQTTETGLFRTQLADGIMGMAIADDTLPTQLMKQGVTNNKIFTLCFRVGGGIMTLGGVDQRIHLKPGISYAKLTRPSGWFTVNLLDILMVSQNGSKDKKSLGVDRSKYDSGKGSIVDSGTTDTYLPQAVQNKFTALFKEISGVAFTTANTPLSEKELARMPDIIFVLEDVDGQPFEVVMPWTSYVDSVGGGKYAFRIYLTEGQGTVLGANFMNGYNVIFDTDGQRVGFSKSECKYEEFAAPQTLPPTMRPTKKPHATSSPNAPSKSASNSSSSSSDSESTEDTGECQSALVPTTACSARCNQQPSNAENGGYVAVGTQTYADRCGKLVEGDGPRPCHEPCVGNRIVRGNATCPEKPWTECLKACIQSRMVPYPEELAQGTCHYTQQTRTCYTGSCAMADGDYLIFIDLRVMVQPSEWSYVHSEAFFGALSSMFKVREGSIELLNDASSEYTMGVKLHFQLRLRAKDFSGSIALHKAAQGIPQAVWGPGFATDLILALETASKKIDGLDYSRYGFLLPKDIEILNSVALPLGDVRDPVEIPNDGEQVVVNHIKGVVKDKIDLFLIGVAIVAVGMCCCTFCVHLRLRREHAAMEKDKVIGDSLMKVYNRFRTWRQGKKVTFDPNGTRYKEVQMNDLTEDPNEDNALDESDDVDGLRA